MSEQLLDSDQLNKLTNIFRILFNRPDLELNDNLTAKDVPGWDSFNHVNLILNIEEEFGVRFSNDEVGGMQNVGNLKALLTSKISWLFQLSANLFPSLQRKIIELNLSSFIILSNPRVSRGI